MKISAKLTCVGLMAALCACHRGDPRPLGVLLITLDTTRADRLSAYGFADAAMPNLDRLARDGVVFDRAASVAPLTLPAHTSLFTGLFPPRHGVRENAGAPLASRHLTLAEVLDSQGFRTAAFVGSAVLDADRGLDQGFDHYSSGREDDPQWAATKQRNAEAVVNDAIRWLDGIHESRFFLWTHLYDPHRPYDPPEPFASRYGNDLYVGEIAYADSQIGRLLDGLDRLHLLDRTIVIVAGDHGESLGEHGERDHGIFIYESVLRVPLIIRAAGVSPRRVPALVRLVDVMPTVLDLLGLRVAPTDGVSLLNVMTGGSQDLDAYSESEYPRRFGWSPLRALGDGRFKLIDAPHPELYDLEQDPFEERNVYRERRTTADALMRRLRTLSQDRSSPLTDRPHQHSSDLRERLAALGYVGTGTIPSAAPSASLVDPKDGVRNLEKNPMKKP